MQLLFATIIFYAFQFAVPLKQQETKPLQELEWLLGSWEYATSEKTKFTEEWKKVDDSTFSGKGALIRKGKIFFSEQLMIRSRNGKIVYVAQVGNQNKGNGIEFALKDTANKTWTFENLAHDFPQRITYKLESENALYARAEATKKGKTRGDDFHYKRVLGK